jgi:hypothetical protein
MELRHTASTTRLLLRHGEISTAHYIQTFDDIAHIKNTQPNIKNLDNHNIKAIFLDYKISYKAYHCYDPIEKRVIISWNTIINEACNCAWRTTMASW